MRVVTIETHIAAFEDLCYENSLLCCSPLVPQHSVHSPPQGCVLSVNHSYENKTIWIHCKTKYQIDSRFPLRAEDTIAISIKCLSFRGDWLLGSQGK